MFARFRGRSNRLLSNPRFRRWAAAFPLTRPIARAQARALFDLCAGFVYSQVLLACVRLGVFELLEDGPEALESLARRMALPSENAERLLDAAVSLRLLVRERDGRYALGPLGAVLVDNEALLSMIEHDALLYEDLRDPVRLLRHGPAESGLGDFWPYAKTASPMQLESRSVARYSKLMTASQPLIADEVLDAFPLKGRSCLLDVGGGEGAFLAAAALREPSLRLMLFDLPAVAERAREKLAALGLADRATVCGGSFLTDPLPRGADVISLVRVLHDHDDDAVLTLLGAVRAALAPGGVVVIAEPMSGTRGAEAMADAYFGFYLLAMGRGRARTPQALADLLRRSGFGACRQLPTRLPIQASVLVAAT